VLEVEADRPVPHLAEPRAGVRQAFTEFTVQTAVRHAFVEAVDSDDVCTPRRGVVPVEARASRREAVKKPADLPVRGEHLESGSRRSHAVPS
jgi:hypothetical protein